MYRPRGDKRLSWPGWLTYSGRFTHISGHPSDTGQAQDRESSPTKDRRSTAVPRNQPSAGVGAKVLCGLPARWYISCCTASQRSMYISRPC